MNQKIVIIILWNTIDLLPSNLKRNYRYAQEETLLTRTKPEFKTL